MARCVLDHLVITAPSLAVGVAFVARTLDVEMHGGGKHPRMGTHNRLLKLGERVYLEVIAVDPDAPAPGQPRWFGLDRVRPDDPPRLAAWVCRTSDIRTTAAAASEALGTVEKMTRGALEWLITIPSDGAPPLGGAAPALIEWPDGVHPADTLPDSGCRLVRFEVRHPDAGRVRAALSSIGLEGVEVASLSAGAQPQLVVRIETPAGPRMLGMPEQPHAR